MSRRFGDAPPVVRRPRLILSTLCALALTLGLLAATAAPATADDVTDAQRAQAAAALLNKQARQFDEPVRTTVSSLYDHLLAFAAAGQPNAASPTGRAWYLLDALEQRASFAEGSTTTSPVKVSGTTTPAVSSIGDILQVIHASAVYDQDPATFAGRDFLTLLEAFEFNGADPSWYRTTTAGTARVTTQVQARVVLALAAAGRDEDASAAASSLTAKQLASGAWSNTYTGTAANFEHTVNAIAALAAEGSEASLTAAGLGADHLIGLQQDDGSFTGGTTPVLVGQAANALRAVGRTEAAEEAAGFVRALQVVDVEGVDPLFDGGIASTAAGKAQIEADTFPALDFANLATNNLRAIFAFTPPLGSLHVDEPAGDRPAVEGNDTFHTGACEGTEGVTMVIDYGYVAPDGMDEPVVSCALGTQPSGWAALENAGVTVGSVPGFVGGALCQLNQVPAQGYPYCWLEEGYWSYWHATPGGMWNYSQWGASNRAPEAGSVEGWRFVPLSGAGIPPRVGPTFRPGIDVTAPVMEFQSGPSGTIEGGKKLTFTWSLDDLGATLECRLDDAEWGSCDEPTSWDATSQQHVLYDVPDGDHVFHVRATDPWDNSSTISREFTIVADENPPTVAITSKPGALTNVTTAAFRMTVDDPDATVQCKLDDAEWGDCTTRVTRNYRGLAEGEHTFTYRATDLAGNSAEVSHTWTIAADAPPVVTISGGTDTYTSVTNRGYASYAVAEAGTITSRECKLDDGAWAACSSTSQANFPGLTLSEGTHTISIRATNGAGRTSEVVTYSWNVDTTAPVIDVRAQPTATTTDRTAQIAFEVIDTSPYDSLMCSVDGGPNDLCTSPLELQDLPLGTHAVTIDVRDAAQNWADSAVIEWTVERDPAIVSGPTVSGESQSSASIATTVKAGNVDQQVFVEYSVNTDHSDAVRSSAKTVAAGAEPAELEFELDGLAKGTDYFVRVVSVATDGEEVATDWQTFTTAGDAAPTVSVRADRTSVVVGQSVTLTWTSTDAETLVASGRWSGNLDPAGGSRTIPVTSAGTHEFVVTATGAGGSTQQKVTVQAALAPTKFKVAIPRGPVYAGRTVTVRMGGLVAGETYSIKVGGVSVASGTAAQGVTSRTVRVPRSLAAGHRAVRVTGSTAQRVGTSTLSVVRAKKLSVRVAKASVKRSTKQRVTVRGLAAHEAVTIRVLGKTYRGKANTKGVFAKTFKVTKKNAKRLGKKKVVVRGVVATRKGQTTFRVRN